MMDKAEERGNNIFLEFPFSFPSSSFRIYLSTWNVSYLRGSSIKLSTIVCTSGDRVTLILKIYNKAIGTCLLSTKLPIVLVFWTISVWRTTHDCWEKLAYYVVRDISSPFLLFFFFTTSAIIFLFFLLFFLYYYWPLFIYYYFIIIITTTLLSSSTTTTTDDAEEERLLSM